LQGIEVTIDQYPYTASSTNLGTMLPDWMLADNTDSLISRIKNPVTNSKATAYMLQQLKKRKLKHFSYAVVAYHKADTTLNGKSIEEINILKGRKHHAKEEVKTIFELMEKGGAGMVFHGMNESDVTYFMQYPYNMFASDAGIRAFGVGNPHPRGYGTNARILGKYVREEKVLILEEAIRRMTSLPALKFQLPNIGLLLPNYNADIVIFDEQTVKDNSTFNAPHQYSSGFEYVLVNGQITVAKGQHTGVKAGKAIRK
jgi:N-acyl-D-amino-acid deacylase